VAASKLADYIITSLGIVEAGKKMPIARTPEIFELVMGLDTMSLIHGFQISNEQISFVGLRHPRALTSSIVGYGCERISVPGVKFNVGQVESESNQAIFQKQRITAQRIEARFSIDVALLASLRLAPPAKSEPAPPVQDLQTPRLKLLVAIALWKVASFLSEFEVEKSLRSECKLKLKGAPKITFDAEGTTAAFAYQTAAAASLATEITAAQLPAARDPLTLTYAS
jgi:CRISPR-associated protein Csb1